MVGLVGAERIFPIECDVGRDRCLAGRSLRTVDSDFHGVWVIKYQVLVYPEIPDNQIHLRNSGKAG